MKFYVPSAFVSIEQCVKYCSIPLFHDLKGSQIILFHCLACNTAEGYRRGRERLLNERTPVKFGQV